MQLSVDGAKDEWREALMRTDLSIVNEKHAAAEHVELLEEKVAVLLGVRLVFTDTADAAAVYEGLLVRAEKEQDRYGGTVDRSGHFQSDADDPLGVQLTAAPDATFECVPDKCLFHLPLNAPVRDMRAYIDQHSRHVVLGFRAHQQAVRDSEKLVLDVKRQFRVRKLSVERSGVPLDSFRTCLRRLREHANLKGDWGHASSLLAYLPNVCVRIVNSDFYAVADDGSLCIPFDFRDD